MNSYEFPEGGIDSQPHNAEDTAAVSVAHRLPEVGLLAAWSYFLFLLEGEVDSCLSQGYFKVPHA